MPFPVPPQEVRLARLGTFLDADGKVVAEFVIYDPTASGLTATDVQAALDEIAAMGGGAAQFDLDTPNGEYRFKTGYTMIAAEAGDGSSTDAYFQATFSGGFYRAEFGSYNGAASSSIVSREGQLTYNADSHTFNQATGNVYLFNGGNGLVFPSLSSDPGSPVAGQVYFNTSSGTFRGYDGSAWGELSLF